MPKTILVAEDDDDSREMLKFALKLSGYRVIEAANGHEVIDRARAERPDLILMDLTMPQLDGLAATRRIKEMAHVADVPVICLTAHVHHYHEEAIEAGCVETILKPVNLEKLNEVISKYLRAD